MRIVHRELVTNIVGATNFTIVNTIAINPGLPTVFPWLSTQAQGWETYKFNRLSFRYMTRVGTGVAGSILMIPEYDAADPAPTTESAASSYLGALETAVWKDAVLVMNPSAMSKTMERHYIRQTPVLDAVHLGPAGGNLDIKTYDCAQLFIATLDGASAVPWGKLWVEYDVTLYTPQVNSMFESTTMVAPVSLAKSRTQPFGGIPAVSTDGAIRILPIDAVTNQIPIEMNGLKPGAEYYLNLLMEGATLNTIGLQPVGATPFHTNKSVMNAAGEDFQQSISFVARAAKEIVNLYMPPNAATTIGDQNSIFLGRLPFNTAL